ncbi:MAG TPA: hypothetical protein ENL42_00905 [Thermoplasmatales archaeon]|nr:hypothetical protein [Thermoplasmatales archaeon]
MRKLTTLVGFILFMCGIWGWSIGVVWELVSPLPFLVFIAGIILMVVGVVARLRTLKEPFKNIIEKFEEMNKPILIAAILILFSALWLLSYGFFGTLFYHASEILLSFPSTENITAVDNFTKAVVHNYNNTILILSYMEIFAGILCIATVVSTLTRKHLSFIISSLVFAAFTSLMFGHYCRLVTTTWNANGAFSVVIGFYSMPISFFYFIILILPAIASVIAILLVVWQYREYMEKM